MSQLRSVYLNKDHAMLMAKKFFKLDITQDEAHVIVWAIKHELISAVNLLKEFIGNKQFDNFELFLKEELKRQAENTESGCKDLFGLEQKQEDIENQLLVFQYVNSKMEEDRFYDYMEIDKGKIDISRLIA